jgi:hypothetical protein
MGWLRHHKPRQRFYLLPGMGGKNLRRKRKLILSWSIVAGLLTAVLLGWVLIKISQ